MIAKTLLSKQPACAIKVSRPVLWLLLAGVFAAALGYLWHERNTPQDVVFQPKLRGIEPPALCPWRTPDADMQAFFPGANGWRTETRILSGRRLELVERLGRAPELDENSLRTYRVLQGDVSVGSVLTRRVKGEHGAIELVLALDKEHRVCGLRLQSMREPEAVSRRIEDPTWLSAFRGRDARSDWRLGQAVPEVPTEARPSAERIVEGVRSLLVLDAVAEERAPQAHH